jgi:mono/diheme cytochrome c family protein/uncharacterized membrane protein
LLMIALAARQLSMLAPVQAQIRSPEARQGSASRPSMPLAAGSPADGTLFGQRCAKCHGADGTGRPARDLLPEIPDFTNDSWQAQRSDPQLSASILDGRGQGMPAMRGKIAESRVRGLVTHVRSFNHSGAKSRPEQQRGLEQIGSAERYRRFEQRMAELRRQYHELASASPGTAPSRASESGKHESIPRSAPWTPEAATLRELFRQRCVKCHGADGTGDKARERMPDIPNFSDTRWQSGRADEQLFASILNGKGDDMPPHRGKISDEQAHGLVKHVRAFAPDKGNARPKENDKPSQSKPAQPDPPPTSVEKRQPAAPPPPGAPVSIFRTVQKPVPAQPASSSPGASEVNDLFRRRCAKCHGADGTGNTARERMLDIPNFSDTRWQSGRADEQLFASILNGKGDDMPPQRGKISDEQARDLAIYVRTFASTTGTPGRTDEQGTASDVAAESEPPPGYIRKWVRWFGRFHPLSVHFPIALLTAAAVAEILGIATRNRARDAIVRYCVWFGALTAAGAGTLGWFLAGFRLTDTSWVLTTHRWLGTSTVACAALVLFLSEASRGEDCRRARRCFRVTLFTIAGLVAVTGFFGGAVVNGLNHYAWPR